ncbi:MAG: hypothetical protein KatS3mg033_0271 [Thermonema sp.]|nr:MULTISPECIES: hypothetical protein [Thermonema]GIV38471.1 MAG: hypothetical protein KatS3mg033_0271 [Thermonema sp.]
MKTLYEKRYKYSLDPVVWGKAKKKDRPLLMAILLLMLLLAAWLS